MNFEFEDIVTGFRNQDIGKFRKNAFANSRLNVQNLHMLEITGTIYSNSEYFFI